jgi:hypothetical protein
MSKYGWERGSIKLPTSDFTKVRKVMEDGAKADAQAAFDETQRFWKGLTAKQKRDQGEYQAAAREFVYGNPYVSTGGWGSRALQDPSRPHSPGVADGHREAVSELLGKALYNRVETPSPHRPGHVSVDHVPCPPKRVLRSDVDFPTNRTTVFRVGSEATVSFDRDRSEVTWAVPDNNHAVENARDHPVAGRFFGAIAKVRWTRGTGGVLTGNDEYNRDNDYAGGGANYCTTAFGPIGAEEEPMQCAEFTDSKGVRHTRQTMFAAAEKARHKMERAMRKREREVRASTGQGRVTRGVPTGGRFTGTHHSESGVSL